MTVGVFIFFLIAEIIYNRRCVQLYCNSLYKLLKEIEMFTTHKLLLNTCIKQIQFYSINMRFLKCSTIKLLENELEYLEPKEKISIVRKKLGVYKGNNIIEWKSAEDVMKRINLENKILFGPVRTAKSGSSRTAKMNTNNKKFLKIDHIPIIQQETQIPIVEPLIKDQIIVRKNSEVHGNDHEIDLGDILKFPLENNVMHSIDKINELNYLRKHLESLSKKSIPSVSRILQKTMSEDGVRILDLWKQNKINELGEEGFQRYHAALLENGASLHNNISSFLSSTPESKLEIKEENIGHWKSLKEVLPNIRNVKLIEEFVTHPFLCYRGVVDCFAQYKDHLVVIDWKTSKKAKTHIKNVYDNPLQVASYVGALNFDPKFQYLAKKGLIVVAYETGMSATVHYINEVNMKYYWNEWLKRVQKFWMMKSSESENL